MIKFSWLGLKVDFIIKILDKNYDQANGSVRKPGGGGEKMGL